MDPEPDWRTLLGNEGLMVSLSRLGMSTPTPNQIEILSKVLGGKSVLACGPYGLHEHLALLIAAVEVMYRFQIASSLYSTANNLSPKVIYLAGSEPLTSTFANEMRFLSEGHIEVGILGRKAAPSALNVQACKWDVLCTTPDKLFEAVDTNIVYLGQLQLLIADEASILQARHWQPTMRDIGRLLRQQQATSGPVHLHVASVFTHASQVSLRQQFKELSPHRIVFRNDSDAKRNVTLTFTVLPDEYATALRPQQTRNFTLSSLWKNRPVIVISPEESDLPQLTAEMRGWLSIDVLEKRVGSTQIICGDEMEQFAKGYSDVLAISLHPYNTGILAPRLQDFSREMCVCIYRLHEADNYRDSFDKWLDLVARMTRMPQIKHCHTLVEAGRPADIDMISSWMVNVRGELPDGLQQPLEVPKH